MSDPDTQYLTQANEYQPNQGRAFNKFTRSHYDICEYENELRIGSKPMKYYVNQLNSPQMNPFTEFTTVGNQKVFNVENNFQRSLPTRLNPIYQTYVFPYSTSPNLGQASPSMQYADTESNLRFGTDLRQKKSSVTLSEIDYNRWQPNIDQTIQNAGQFIAQGRGLDKQGYYDYKTQNNVIFANSAWPNGGMSSRNQLHNFQDVHGC